MGVIVDDGIRKEIERLESAGNFSLADLLRGESEVSLQSLAFQASVPARYMTLVTNSAASATVKDRHGGGMRSARDEEDDEERDAHQRAIDRNILHLRLRGEDVDISQGDMRKAMEARVAALEERRRELLRSGQNPEEVNRIENLVAAYKPVISEIKTGRASAGTTAAIEDLANRDPGLMTEIHAVKAEAVRTPERRASSSAQYFAEGGVAGPSLKAAFSPERNA